MDEQKYTVQVEVSCIREGAEYAAQHHAYAAENLTASQATALTAEIDASIATSIGAHQP